MDDLGGKPTIFGNIHNIENGCFTKHPFINGWKWGSRWLHCILFCSVSSRGRSPPNRYSRGKKIQLVWNLFGAMVVEPLIQKLCWPKWIFFLSRNQALQNISCWPQNSIPRIFYICLKHIQDTFFFFNRFTDSHINVFVSHFWHPILKLNTEKHTLEISKSKKTSENHSNTYGCFRK